MVGAALAVLLIAAVATYIVKRRGGDGDGGAPPPRTQRTLLLQIPADDKTALASALLASDPASGRGSMTLLPSRVISEVPGHGDTLFGRAVALGGPELARNTLANLLGVIVDGTWTLTPAGLGSLVDAVDGVVVDVNSDVTRKGKDGRTEVVLKAGAAQTLDGESAVAYATFVGAEEQELARLARLQVVLEGVIKRLPDSTEAIGKLVGGKAGSAATMPTGEIAKLLRGLAVGYGKDAVSPSVLPVTEIDTGGEGNTYRIESDAVEALVQKDLAGSVPHNRFGANNRVLVRNGVGTAGIGQSVTAKLTPAGFRVVGTGNAPTFDHAQTAVLVFEEGDEAVEAGRRVAEVLGVSEDAVRLSHVNQSVADVIVIVGKDYKP